MNKLTISYVPTNIYKRLKAKNSKQVGIGQDTVGPSEKIATSEWVQNLVCLQKKGETERLNLCRNTIEKPKCSPSGHRIKDSTYSVKQNCKRL